MSSDTPLLSVYALHLTNALKDFGVNPTPYLKALGLSRADLEGSEQRLSMERYFRLVEAILEDELHPCLGLEVGQHLSVLDHGLLGYSVFSCENLRRAFALYTKYGDLIGLTVVGQISILGDEVSYHIRPSEAEVLIRKDLYRYETELEFSNWANYGALFNGDQPWVSEVCFTFDNSAHRSDYEAFFGCPVFFNSERNELRFAADYLDAPFNSSNQEAAAVCEARCAGILAELTHSGGVIGDIHRLLARSAGRYPCIAEVAAHFHLSESTLRRQLVRSGTSYKKLLNTFRMDLAREYLLQTDLSIGEIAATVGYTEPSNFHRAFRLHTGRTPQAIRGGL